MNPSISNQTNQNRSPLIIGLLFFGIAFVLVLFGVIIASFASSRSGTLVLNYSPASAVATINGKEYSAGEYSLPVGTYEVSVSKLGFETETETIIVSGNSKTPALFILNPNSEFTKNWYTTNKSDAMLADGIVGQMDEFSSAQTLAENPIIKKLPIKYTDFQIYSSSCDNSFCINIYAAPENREKALEYFIDNLDKNIGKYKIIFMDYTNPFTGDY